MSGLPVRKDIPQTSIEKLEQLTSQDMNDLCDATDAAIEAGGGFGWLHLPSRQMMERYWQGVLLVESKDIYVARLDDVISGTAQLIRYPNNNKAQNFSAKLRTFFIAPWARGYGLAKMMLQKIEEDAAEQGIDVLNVQIRDTQQAGLELFESMGYSCWGVNPLYAKKDDGTIIKGHYYQKDIRRS